MAKKKQRSYQILELYGREMHIERAAMIAGCQVMTIHNRLIAGMDDKLAVFSPLTAAEKADEREIQNLAEFSGTKWNGNMSNYGGARHPAECQEIQYHGGRFNRGEW